MDPFLRWAGSKRKLLPKLAPYWGEDHKRYVEPFMGSAALFFFLEPDNALLSDVNGDLVNAFTAVRDHPIAVHNRLKKLPTGSDSYYKTRAVDPDELPPLDAAARFIYLNRFCFNGLYRTNTAGKFNVPYSPSKTGRIPSREKLIEVSQKLQGKRILQADYAKILGSHVRRSDFIYLDPPYAVENRRIFKQYGPHVFGSSDMEELASCLEKIDAKEASFLLSYAYSREALDLFGGWTTHRVYAQRNIAGFVKHRRRACELLVTNIC